MLVACAGFVMVSVYVDEHDAANKVLQWLRERNVDIYDDISSLKNRS